MTTIIAACLVLVALAGTAAVLAPSGDRQAPVLSAFGLVLTALFLALQAPDVALSQLAIGAAVVPLMILLALRKIDAVRSRR
jgi:uncharacterized MnhB-related membrane protein